MSRDAATSMVRTLREAGHQAYLVGGCVRDLVLGREPADYDVATDGRPAEVMRIFPRSYAVVAVPRAAPAEGCVLFSPGTRAGGRRLGVCLAPADGGAATVEVATFRSDI